MRAIAQAHQSPSSLLFHAGDGNLHPHLFFDERDREGTARAHRAGQEMLKACVELGGSISGEHGIGIEKRAAMGWLFPPETLGLFRRIKAAFDPENLANPDKMFPLPGEPLPAPVRPARPCSPAAQALIDAVRERAAERRPFSLFGARSKILKAVADREKGWLTTRPLSAILELEREDFTVTAEAGISLSELKSRLDPEGFFVPLPVSTGTLGGLLATKPWPGVRDGILGMRVLLPDGTVHDLGGKVMKNVAGYDVPRLLLGSWGTLAILLDMTLRLSPIPPELPGELPKPKLPRMVSWHRRLKRAFDPQALLNGWFEEPR